jgi:hypothetical protein
MRYSKYLLLIPVLLTHWLPAFFLPMPIEAQELANEPLAMLDPRQAMMPTGFSDVLLGMRVEALRGTRKVQPLTFGDGPVDKARIWMERTTNSPFFDSIIYTFADSTNELISVGFLRERKGFELKTNTPNFVAACIAKWGDSYSVEAVELRHARRVYEAAALVWGFQQAKVFAVFTPPELADASVKSVFQISIVKPSLNNTGVLRVIEKDAESKTRLRSAVDALKRQAELPLRSPL